MLSEWRCVECGLLWKDGRTVCTHSVTARERHLVEFPDMEASSQDDVEAVR